MVNRIEPTIIEVYSATKEQFFTFEVPGIAFIDGRDLNSKPPLTVMKINLWNGPNQAKIIGYLWHGVGVEVTEAKQYEDRWFFKVRLGSRSGWVSDYVLSDANYDPVGDEV